jgi:acyl carrier protein
MIPSIFMFLDVLPLMPNGKIDRDAMPSPDGERSQLDPAFVEPRTEIEELVAQIWRELLKRDRIGVCDNFFELGGHSLLATRVVARLQNNFQVDFPLRKLFELPTVAGLAAYIDKLRRSSAGTSIMPIVRAASYERSMMRPFAKGPRSLTSTSTQRPVSRLVTRTRVPSGSV